MNRDFEQIKEALEWYADRANYQEGIAGDRTLFGWESDNGDRARKVLRSLDRLGAIVQYLGSSILREFSRIPIRENSRQGEGFRDFSA